MGTKSPKPVAKSAATKKSEPSDADKALAFDQIFRILYENEEGEIDPNKEWDQGTIELVAEEVKSVKSPD